MPLDMRRASGSRRSTSLINVQDFTGGLNLNTDTFKLKPNESPSMLNVDIDRRGGFQLRKGVDALTSALSTEVVTGTRFTADDSGGSQSEEVAVWYASTGKHHVMLEDGTLIAQTTAGSVNTTKRRFAVFNNVLYSVSDYLSGAVFKWDGSWTSYHVSWDYTALTSDGGATWQNDLASPSTGYAVRGRYLATHQNFLWVAHVYETQAYPNRVRWSHPGQPESWRQVDYIDIDVGRDNDEITAILPYQDHLLVFKNRSVHAIFGYDPDSFQVVGVSQTLGCPSQEAVVATDQGVFWWDARVGLVQYDGKKVQWRGESIHQPILDDTIPADSMSEVYVGWVDRRVWCVVPYGVGETDRTHSFIYDPQFESWMLYDLAAGPFITAFNRPLASLQGTKRVFDLTANSGIDDLTVGGESHIDSHYKTSWIDMRQPAVKKRWRGMEAVLKGGADSFIRVEAYLDYNQSDPQAEFSMSLSAGGTDFNWGDDWDENYWYAGSDYDTIVKGSGMGVARAVALKFNGPDVDNVEWGVNGFTLKAIPKRVR